MSNKLLENFYNNGDFKIPNCENPRRKPCCDSHPQISNCHCEAQTPSPCKPSKTCELIVGNSLEVEVHGDDCEIRADIEVARKNTVRLWGQVKDCEGKPVEGALVKLLKQTVVCDKPNYAGIAHAVTDCLGFYQFEICPCHSSTKYRILVGKAAIGSEKIINSNGTCNPCHCK